MKNDNLIITPSGIRGIVGEGLIVPTVINLVSAYGQWIQKFGNEVIIGRDTRISGEMLESAVISALVSVGCKVINLGICPAPVIIYTKNKLKVPGGIIISGSHNPPEWNALKFLSQETFLSKVELEEITEISDSDKIKYAAWDTLSQIKVIDPIDDYLSDLLKHLESDSIKEKNKLKIVVDTGAGTAKDIVPKMLESLGCEVKVINNELLEGNDFPRNPEPVESNLESLIEIIKNGQFDVGFAYDCDADRLGIVGDNGQWYQEDISLGLIAEHTFNELSEEKKKGIFVTNIASSLMFDSIVNKYDGSIIRTPIGERYLAEKMFLIEKKKEELNIGKGSFIFGGEGSCGGVMFPSFNNARDGIFATAKIIEILVKSGESLSSLIDKLPKFYSKRETITSHGIDMKKIRDNLKEHSIVKDNFFSEIDKDIKILKPNYWFVLIHPSNTEPIIRIISEAKSEELAIKLVRLISQIIKKISKN
ncbi:Phosphoglucosamine mutase [subsurface metagenome]